MAEISILLNKEIILSYRKYPGTYPNVGFTKFGSESRQFI
jgi:hypothetical protein